MLRTAVRCRIVDGWVDHWCTDVSWVWWIPNRNAAVLLLNNKIRNNRILHHYPPECNPQLTMPRTTTPKPQNITLPRVTPRRERSTTPRRERSTTPRRERSTTPPHMLLQPFTPRLPSTTPQTTLPQLATWRFLKARAEISIWFFYICRLSSWSLITGN
jgi:hypothetical protein